MAEFLINGDNTTINFEYTALTTKIQDIVGDASEYLWNAGKGDHGTEEEPIVFADLTNQEKLNIVDEYLKQVILDASNTFKSLEAQKLARETEAESEHTL